MVFIESSFTLSLSVHVVLKQLSRDKWGYSSFLPPSTPFLFFLFYSYVKVMHVCACVVIQSSWLSPPSPPHRLPPRPRHTVSLLPSEICLCCEIFFKDSVRPPSHCGSSRESPADLIRIQIHLRVSLTQISFEKKKKRDQTVNLKENNADW